MAAAVVSAAARPAVARPAAVAARPRAATSRHPAPRRCFAAAPQRPRRPPAPPRAAAEDEGDSEEELSDEEAAEEVELAEGGQPDEAWVQKMLAEAGPQPENADGDDDDDDGPGVLLITQQHGLGRWEPAALPRKLQQLEAGDAAAARAAAQEGGGSKAAEVYEAQRQLPGLQRAVRREAQEGSGLPDLEALKRFPEDEMRVPRKPEPVLTEWDLRAKMEKRRRHERETAEWNARRAAVGRYPSFASDWRTDVRCQWTGDPTGPTYREWSHEEIWDLITANGRNADPRDVGLWVLNPNAIADAPAQDSDYQMETEEYFASQGRLISEEDLQAIADSAGGGADADAILLSPDFDDFDPSLVGGFDGGFAAGGGGEGGEDEAF